MKGKDMILSDFLSQQKNDDSDPSEIIPISFNAYRILEENRKIDVCKNEEKFLIQTCSQAKTSSTKLPGSAWCKEGAKSKPEARKTTCHAQKRYDRKAVYRSGESRIEKKAC